MSPGTRAGIHRSCGTTTSISPQPASMPRWAWIGLRKQHKRVRTANKHCREHIVPQ